MTDYQSGNLILHHVTEEDMPEVARTWPADHHPLSDTEAREAIAGMRGNYGRNTKGCIFHLCMAVCGKESPGTIMVTKAKRIMTGCIFRPARGIL